MKRAIWIFLAGILLFSGCAQRGYTIENSGDILITYKGTVERTRVVPLQDSGAGAILGGIVGAILGHQFGGGSGRDIATAAGAVGGAIVGSKMAKATGEEVMIRLDNGQTITTIIRIDPNDPYLLRRGERVFVYVKGNRVLKIEPIR